MRKMITKEQVIPTILKACPFYKETWEKHLEFYEEELLFVFVPDLVNSVTELDKENKQQEILSIFEVIEKLLVEGDESVKNLIEVGVLEDFRHIFGQDFEKFSKYLLPNSFEFWRSVPERELDKIKYPKSVL